MVRKPIFIFLINLFFIYYINGLSISGYLQEDSTFYLYGDFAGNSPLTLKVYMGPIEYNDKDITLSGDAKTISFILKEGSKNKDLILYDIFGNTEYNEVVLKPKITQVTPSPLPTWSTTSLQIYGTYIDAATGPSNIVVYQDEKPIDFSAASNILTVTPNQGAGRSIFTVMVDGKKSDGFYAYYVAHTITLITNPIYSSLDYLTITGNNFSPNSKIDTKIKFGNNYCSEIISFSITTLEAKCDNSVPYTGNIIVEVNINGVPVSGTTFYAPISASSTAVLLDGSIELSIRNYSPGTTFKLSGIDVTSYCILTKKNGTVSDFSCDIPNNVKINSGPVEYQDALGIRAISTIDLIPYPTSFEPNLDYKFPTQGQKLTIFGKYLNKDDSQGSSNEVKVHYGSNTYDSNNIEFIDANTFKFQIPSGSGNTNPLFFTSHSFTNALKSFNIIYKNPSIYSSNINNNIVTLNGNDFGDDKGLITIWYNDNKIPTDSIQLTVPHQQIQFSSSSSPRLFNITVNGLSSPDYIQPKVISSSSLFPNNPGNITITASDFQQNDLKVYVSNIECLNPYAPDLTTIICHYDASVKPDQFGRALNISITSVGLTGTNEVFYYYDTNIECPFKCSNHGACNNKTGECLCNDGWKGLYCQEASGSVQLPPPIIDENGNTIIIGGSLNFTVSILYLRENNILGEQVRYLSFSKDLTWDNRTKINETKHYYKGKFIDNGPTVELDVNYYKEETLFNFAGEEITIPSNSMKYVISISNYQFDSTTNTLEVIYSSKTKLHSSNDCKSIKTNDEYYSSNNDTQEESINWFQVNSADTSFQTKFSKRVFVDDKVRKSTTKILNYNDPIYSDFNKTNNIQDNDENDYNKLISIGMPYFSNKVSMDPSFSALLRSPTDSCNKKNWKLPLILTLCIVGGAIIVIITAIVIKRNRSKLLEKNFIIKLRRLRYK
ncbi:hypothetical protein DICPUDRAFT_83589 [Dictyostelium purpureum]|uniref:EGF-like domain-containing protein n=1 Tax=Dictyostelium purpureum TaxID=5786 RepID=F0ZZZ6_DICPU|nr:uncharacterized protein DICPUDRAFT_83589 [Dictyostelium purpureum]EGC30488.1 hypothetical protein DICPUDRAFT_83589 [Dictyostelium purpureum]|eukprot:XP_003292990.1 hypothetical protein DICPUDRAFT_83589 [Dictyostelium purpureum]